MLDDELRALTVHDVSDDAARRLHAQMLSRHQAMKKRAEVMRAVVLASTCVTYLTWAVAFTIGLR